ncbi:MAG: hypothetical protein AAF799_05130 [Myxococcota bacterium]
MIPHVITHPTRPEILHFSYDFDDKTTKVRHRALVESQWRDLAELCIDRLLRYPQARGEDWFVASMPVREFGSPAFVERWSWGGLEAEEKQTIEHARFGLMALGVSPSTELLIADRYFPSDDDPLAGARVLRRSDRSIQGEMEINAGMSSPIFDEAESRVAMVLYDQGGCSANVYALAEGKATLLAELAERQIVTDFESGCVAFLPDERLLVWSTQNWDFGGQVGLYSIATGTADFVVEVPTATELDGDEDDFSHLFENTERAVVVDGQHALVGSVGAVARVDLADGSIEAIEIPGAGAIVQVRRCGDQVIALDHENQIHLVPGAS